jgi:hypothetical protein
MKTSALQFHFLNTTKGNMGFGSRIPNSCYAGRVGFRNMLSNMRKMVRVLWMDSFD